MLNKSFNPFEKNFNFGNFDKKGYGDELGFGRGCGDVSGSGFGVFGLDYCYAGGCGSGCGDEYGEGYSTFDIRGYGGGCGDGRCNGFGRF